MGAMRYFLAKTEPSTYSITDLEHDRETDWDGVTNPQARATIRTMTIGDRLLIYHSGEERAIVGLAQIIGSPEVDPHNPKSTIVKVKFLARFNSPLTLSMIKSDPVFADWALVRQGRLSTMFVPEKIVDRLKRKGLGI